MPFQLECSGQRILGRQGYLVCKSLIILVMKHSSKWSELVWWRQKVLNSDKYQQAQCCLTVTKKGSNSTKQSSQCHAEWSKCVKTSLETNNRVMLRSISVVQSDEKSLTSHRRTTEESVIVYMRKYQYKQLYKITITKHVIYLII